jgi:hypothetical protein
MWSKIVAWARRTWEQEKAALVERIIKALDSTKVSVQDIVITEIKECYSEEDLSKMTVEQVISLSIDKAYNEVETLIKRQI